MPLLRVAWTTVVVYSSARRIKRRTSYAAVRLVSNTRKYDRGLTHIRRNVLHWLDVTDRVRFRVCVQVFKCLHGVAPDYLSTVPSCIQTPWTPESSLCESRTARRPTRYIVVVRCSSLRACWSISVEHSIAARSSQEPQSTSAAAVAECSTEMNQHARRLEHRTTTM